MSIYVIRLLSGAELISEVKLEDESKSLFSQTLILTKPLRFIALGKDENNHPRIGFGGHVVSDPECDELILNGAAIESYIEPHKIYDDLKKEYKQNTSLIQMI